MAETLHSFLGQRAEAFLVVDADGRIRDVNQYFCDLFGYSAEELLTLTLAKIEADKTAGAIRKHLRDIAAAGSERYQAELRRHDGITCEIEINATAVQVDQEWFYLLFFTDLAASEEIINRSVIESKLMDLFVQAASRKEYLDGVVNLVSRYSGTRCLGIRVLDWLGNIPYEAVKGFDRSFWEKENWLSVQKDKCICPRVIMETPDALEVPGLTGGGSFICNNTIEFGKSLDPDQSKRYRGNCWKAGFASLAIIPLRLRGEVLGAIQLADERPEALPKEKVEFIESMTPHICAALKHYNTTEELQQNYDTQIVSGLLARLSLENLSPGELAQRALEIILSIPWLLHDKTSAGGIFLVDENEPDFLQLAAQQGMSKKLQKSCARLPFGRCLCGRAAEKQEIIFTNGGDPEPELLCKGSSPHGHYCVPIISTEKKILGVINVHVREGHRHSEQEDQSLTAIANTLAIGIQRKQAEIGLWRANELLERMFASAGLLVAYMDTGFNYIRVNRAFAEKDDHTPEFYIDKNHFDLFPGLEELGIFQKVVETGKPHYARAKPLEHERLPERGITYWDWNLQLVREADGGVGGLVLSLIDVTARERAEQSLKRRTAQAESLVRVAGRLNTTLDLDMVLQAVCEEVAKALNAPAVSVALYNVRRDEIYQAAAIGLPADFCQKMNPIPIAEYGDHASEQGHLVVTPDLQASPAAANADVYREFDIRTGVSVTLQQGGRLIGSLNIYSIGEERHFFEEDLSLIQGLADQAALAINNARVFSEATARLNHIVSLRAIDMAIASSMDLRVILTVFLDQVNQQLGADAVDVLLLNRHTHLLEYAVGRGIESEALKHTQLQLGQGYGGRVALERCVVSVADMTEDTSSFNRSPRLNQENFVAYHGAPLVAKGQVVGVLEVFHRRRFEPEPEWLEFLEVFTGQAAIAVDNATLFSELQQSNTELGMAYDATLEGWSRALDLRDKETEGHTQRVTEMTLRLSRSMGIGDAELAHVRRGALLHDIGKMGIPDKILLKPGPLTKEEWKIMRRHPVYALDLLVPVAYLRQALDIPYCHHEKWDGTGYPRRLKSNQIPLTARIFSVVDVWDALSSNRPYRTAWPQDKVINYLREESGRHFDPQVVEAFLQMLQTTEPSIVEKLGEVGGEDTGESMG